MPFVDQWWWSVDEKRQCTLAGVARSTVYANRKPVLVMEIDVLLKRLIDDEYTRNLFYGSRKMVVYLGHCEQGVNCKRAQRLMRSMGLAAIEPGPNTSWAEPQHNLYPYLLHGHQVQPLGTRLCVPGGHHRLVLEEGAQLANHQQHGSGVLRGLLGGCLARARQT